MSEFRLSVTFLNGDFHGRGDNGVPEWPPSPLRVFQALLATAAARWRMPLPDDVAAALDWLADQPPPEIVAPPFQAGTPYQTSVPNNAMDIVAGCWSRGNETSKDANPATHKAMKEICPTHLLVDDQTPARVTFVWSIDPSEEASTARHVNVLGDLASRLYQVGWGLDLVAGHADVANGSATPLVGERWAPTSGGGVSLRTPRSTARRFLQERHERFLGRLSNKTLMPVPPLPQAAYDVIAYRRASDVAEVAVAAFAFLKLDGSGYRAFGRTQGCRVAGMLRHAVAEMARTVGWSEETIARLVRGHGEPRDDETHQPVGRDRFAYVPLPSIEPRRRDRPAQHVGMIRRVLIYVPAAARDAEIATLRRMLAGCELLNAEREPQALISPLPLSDGIVRRYCPREPASTWTTVTPVILPGRDDRKPRKTERLLRKALRQAGFANELVDHAELDWRDVGFWPGAERVDRYFVPMHLREFPRYHVRVCWNDPDKCPLPIPGPVVCGGGRYSGLGLFAAEKQTANVQ